MNEIRTVPVGFQLLTILRIDLSHVNEHKFTHNFREFFNPLCSYNLETGAISHYMLRCHLLQLDQRTLLNDIKETDEHITTCCMRLNATTLIQTE